MKMMKTTILSIATLLLFSLTGCEKYNDPAPYTPAVMTATMNIMQFKALYQGTPLVISRTDIVLAGKIVSTDRYGNFYRSFFIQDTTLNGGAIEIKVGRTGLYNDYKVGQVIYVNPYGLCLGQYGNLQNLGYRSENPKYETGYIDIPAIINASIFRGVMATPVSPVNITTAADITEPRFGMLVTLKGATYKGGAGGLKTWAIPANPDTGQEADYGEQNFQLANSATTVVVRSSGYAKFAGTTVPFAVGQKVDITGVLTKYNATYQLILNTDADAKAQ